MRRVVTTGVTSAAVCAVLAMLQPDGDFALAMIGWTCGALALGLLVPTDAVGVTARTFPAWLIAGWVVTTAIGLVVRYGGIVPWWPNEHEARGLFAAGVLPVALLGGMLLRRTQCIEGGHDPVSFGAHASVTAGVLVGVLLWRSIQQPHAAVCVAIGAALVFVALASMRGTRALRSVETPPPELPDRALDEIGTVGFGIVLAYGFAALLVRNDVTCVLAGASLVACLVRKPLRAGGAWACAVPVLMIAGLVAFAWWPSLVVHAKLRHGEAPASTDRAMVPLRVACLFVGAALATAIAQIDGQQSMCAIAVAEQHAFVARWLALGFGGGAAVFVSFDRETVGWRRQLAIGVSAVITVVLLLLGWPARF